MCIEHRAGLNVSFRQRCGLVVDYSEVKLHRAAFREETTLAGGGELLGDLELVDNCIYSMPGQVSGWIS